MNVETGLQLEQANSIICDQEDAIAELKQQISIMEDQRDVKQGKLIELQKALRRVECADDLEVCHRIAREAARIGI